MPNENIVIDEDEMNRIIEILEGCSEESYAVSQGFLTIQTELKDNIYDGMANANLYNTTYGLAVGMYRMSIIYQQLGLILTDILKKFKEIDDKEGENAKKSVAPQGQSDR